MEFLKENRNLVIIVAILVIGYLLLKTEMFKNIVGQITEKWNELSNIAKLIIVVVVVYVAYHYYHREY